MERLRTALASGDDAAILAASRADFADLLSRADARELTALGDAARRQGAPEEAAVWSAVHRRFPATASARTAAFHLGRKASAAGDRGAAARWLADAATDSAAPFHREALGRLIEVTHQQADDAAARRNAEKYLAAYPDGPHAGLARSILGADRP